MKTIWKYGLKMVDSQEINMPEGAEILTVQTQFDMPCIWALVDPKAKIEQRFFVIYGTGHDIYFDMGVKRKYIGTFQIMKGAGIYHLFERI